MKKIYKYTLIFLLFLFSTSQLFATHIQGMDLSFKCNGGLSYTFTLNFYRDCAGIAPIVKPLFLKSASNKYIAEAFFSQIDTPVDISPLCPKDRNLSTCNGGTLPGSQVWIYQVTVTLPYQAKDWVFYYDDIARNPAITNIVNPGNTGIRVQDSLDNTSNSCINSPIFSNPPVPYVCDGDPFTYNHGGYDSDGDSLAYQLVAPEDTTGLPVVYIPGLSYDSVLIEKKGVPYYLNPTTGQITFQPALGISQITVTAVRIYIYRNGKCIGYVTRDIEIIVQNCTNTPPYSSGIQNLVGGGLTGSNSFTLCANSQTSFQITAQDSDLPKQAITITTNASLVLPGAIVAITDTNPSYLNITWKPTNADTGFHNFTVSMKDDNCPIYGISVYSYQIYVSPSTYAGPDVSICYPDTTRLTATGGRHFVWTPSTGLVNPDSSSTIASPSVTTTYVVTSNLTNICKNKDTVVVNVSPSFTVSISADTGKICPGTVVPFNAVISGGNGDVFSYLWSSSPTGISSTLSGITDTAKFPETYYVKVTGGLCKDSASFRTNVDTTANANFSIKDTVCASQQYNVVYTGHSPVDANFNWSFGGANVISGSGRGPFLIDYVDPGGPYTIALTVTNTDNCSATYSKQVYVGTPFTINISGDPTICRTSSAQLNTSITGGGNGSYSYNWSSTPTGFLSDSTNPIVSPVITTTYHVLSQSYGCSDTSSFVVTVDSNALAAFLDVDTVCQDEPFNVVFQGYAQAKATYKWTFNNATIKSGTGQGPYTVSYPNPGTYTVSLLVKNPDGCADSVSKQVYVSQQFTARIKADTNICSNTPQTLSVITSGGIDSPYIYTWRSNPVGFTSTSPNPEVAPVVTTTYYVDMHCNVGCNDSAFIVIHIDTLAKSAFTIPDTVCANQQFFATYTGTSPKNSQYFWSFSGANEITGSGVGPYLLQYSKGGVYRITLKVTDSIGCSDTSSKLIYVDPLPQDTFNVEPREGCEPLTVSFSINSTPGAKYVWNFGDGTGSTAQDTTHTYKHGIYGVTLTVTDPFGCTQTYEVGNYITVDTTVIAAFTTTADTGVLYDYTSNNTFQFTSQSSNADSYSWTFGDGTTSTDENPSHTYTEIGTYYVKLIVCDSLGCCDTANFGPIHIQNLNDYYLPSAFTPGGASNNHFHILGFGLQNADLRVYDRWGELVWEGTGADATDANDGWDGTYKGKAQPMDVYVWYASATLATGKTVTKKGNLTLIR